MKRWKQSAKVFNALYYKKYRGVFEYTKRKAIRRKHVQACLSKLNDKGLWKHTLNYNLVTIQNTHIYSNSNKNVVYDFRLCVGMCTLGILYAFIPMYDLNLSNDDTKGKLFCTIDVFSVGVEKHISRYNFYLRSSNDLVYNVKYHNMNDKTTRYFIWKNIIPFGYYDFIMNILTAKYDKVHPDWVDITTIMDDKTHIKLKL